MSPTFTTIGVHLLSNGIRADVIQGAWPTGDVAYWLRAVDRNGYLFLSVPQSDCPRIDHL